MTTSRYSREEYALARDAMRMEIAALGPGNHTILCPLCHGGQSREKKMSVTVGDAGALYHCKRATCNWGGGTGRVDGVSSSKALFRPRPWNGTLLGGETVVDLRAFDGTALGHQTRLKLEDGRKFVKTWPITTRSAYHAPTTGADHHPCLWLVEDAASAGRLADAGRLSAALLGTYMSVGWAEFELLPAIAHYGVHRILVALDPGAEPAAVQIKNKLTYGYGLDSVCIPLKDDIKDLSAKDFKDLLEYYDADSLPATPRSSYTGPR